MKLRKELLPPELDENKIVQLAELAERLDDCDNSLEDCDGLRTQFNSLAVTNLRAADFHFSGATAAETFVRRVLTAKPQKIADVFYDELLELVTRICNADGTEHEIDFWLSFLEIQLANNRLSDLIFYSEHYFDDANRRDLSPKEILDIALEEPRQVIILPFSNP